MKNTNLTLSQQLNSDQQLHTLSDHITREFQRTFFFVECTFFSVAAEEKPRTCADNKGNNMKAAFFFFVLQSTRCLLQETH